VTALARWMYWPRPCKDGKWRSRTEETSSGKPLLGYLEEFGNSPVSNATRFTFGARLRIICGISLGSDGYLARHICFSSHQV
jgi:hypothetical protein